MTESWVFPLILFVPAAWLMVALLGVFLPRAFFWVSKILFPAGAFISLALAVLSFLALSEPPQNVILPLGLPSYPFHFRLDALSAFFLFLQGGASFGILLYTAGYIKAREGTLPGVQCFFYHAFLASMSLVFLADDPFSFMFAWEGMALSSYFLVASEHRHEEIRRASYLYLLMAHLGGLALLVSFFAMSTGADAFHFEAIRFASRGGLLPPALASTAFLFAVFGFATKAGLLPLHLWLPEAHPAAPSPASALMSGVMLKTAAYGMMRVGFDLLQTHARWWGTVLVILGVIAALFGVVFAAVQSDMKRLLAYSSIENLGLIFVGIGLSLIFMRSNMWFIASLALCAALYHALNHAFFKSLLFLGTGSVLHATHERNLGKLGGLIHAMPWVAWLSLIGALASAGLPPLNGFISEWLLLQSFLFTSSIPDSYLSMILPITAAAIVLVATLAAYTMVKFFGIIFLGQMREEKLKDATDANWLERLGLLFLAASCILLGVFPTVVIDKITPLLTFLTGSQRPVAADGALWLFAPIHAERASFSPLIFLLALLVLTPLFWWVIRKLFHKASRRVPPWDCGFPLLTPHMQDSAEGFGQPIRRIFAFFMLRERHHPSPFDETPYYVSKVTDPFLTRLYLPIVRGFDRLFDFILHFQKKSIASYLMYSFVTLLLLLLLARG